MEIESLQFISFNSFWSISYFPVGMTSLHVMVDTYCPLLKSCHSNYQDKCSEHDGFFCKYCQGYIKSLSLDYLFLPFKWIQIFIISSTYNLIFHYYLDYNILHCFIPPLLIYQICSHDNSLFLLVYSTIANFV